MSELSATSVKVRSVSNRDTIADNSKILQKSYVVGGFEDVVADLDGDYEFRIITDYEIEKCLVHGTQDEYVLADEQTIESVVATASIEEPEAQKAQDRAKNTPQERRLGRAARKSAEFLGSGTRVTAALGILAIAGGLGAPFIRGYSEHKSNGVRHVEIQDTAISSGLVEYNNVDTSTVWMPIGGFGQGQAPPVGQMEAGGYIQNGMMVDPIFYSGNILGPLGGSETMVSSEQGGVDYGFTRYKLAQAQGQNVNIPAFSEGTGVQRKLAWQIYHDNGNQWPANVTLTQIDGPYHPGGIWDSQFTKVVSPFLKLDGFDTGDGANNFPPGTRVEYVYFADDPYAGNGNENFLTFMKNFVGLGVGNHDIPNQNNPESQHTQVVVIRDNQGNLHKIYVRDQDVFITAIQNAGIQVMDPVDATAAINAFFPQNIDPNSTTPPRADVRAGLQFAAKALDKQMGPNVTILEDVVNRMPDSWKQTMDDGWNGINDSMNAIAIAINNPTPQNIKVAFDTVTRVVGNVSGDLNKVFEHPVPDVAHFGANIAADQLQQATGIDMHQQFQQLADMLIQPHPEVRAFIQSWQNPVPVAQPIIPPQPRIALPQLNVNTQLPRGPLSIQPDNHEAPTPTITAPSQLNDIPGEPANNHARPPITLNIPRPIRPTIDASVPEPIIPATIPPLPTTPVPSPVISAPAPAPRPEVVVQPVAPAIIPLPEITPAPAPAPAPAPIPRFIPAPEPAAPIIDTPPAPVPAPAPAPAPIERLPVPVMPSIHIPFLAPRQSSHPSFTPPSIDSLPDRNSSAPDGLIPLPAN